MSCSASGAVKSGASLDLATVAEESAAPFRVLWSVLMSTRFPGRGPSSDVDEDALFTLAAIGIAGYSSNTVGLEVMVEGVGGWAADGLCVDPECQDTICEDSRKMV
jgi:hypothetical protein